MPTKSLLLTTLLLMALPAPVFADGGHGGAIYHAFRMEIGTGGVDDGAGFADSDLDGWVGTDADKLWLKSEGERENGATNQAEFWALYSRNIEVFWDFQLGVRHDTRPGSLTYGVVGFEGLAPYFFETEAHLFVSEDGDASARLRQENEFLVTQKLIIQPYVEADIYAQDVPVLEVGAGLSSMELGIQARYEFTRAFAPYVDVRYERKFGETSSVARRNGEGSDAVIGTLGVRLLF